MTNLELEELAIQLNIPAVGVASWPLPAEASLHLDTPYPCPFTNGSIEERLQGSTTIASPKSAIVCLFPYYMPREGVTNLARYCWGDDYHVVVRQYLERLVEVLRERYPDEIYEIHCDTSPLADRYMAYLAGLGFYGWNQTFINPTWGSYTVIGTIMTTLALPPSSPLNQTCLQCGACLRACPGKALQGDHLDYRTCKSYLTQCKGDLSEEEERIIGKTPLIFGCDVCQEVCPHNRDIPMTPIPEFQQVTSYIEMEELEGMTNEEFKAKYGHKAWAWRGKKVLLRNAEIVRKEKHEGK